MSLRGKLFALTYDRQTAKVERASSCCSSSTSAPATPGSPATRTA
jgi:hypothetical protein